MNAALSFFERLRIQGNPLAASGCIVVYGHARFTILTTRLIRLEWAHEGQFEDRSTFAFPNRYGDVPAFSDAVNEPVVEIKTDFLTLTYTEDGKPFHPANLSIRLNVELVGCKMDARYGQCRQSARHTSHFRSMRR